jgi:hypothetical protein
VSTASDEPPNQIGIGRCTTRLGVCGAARLGDAWMPIMKPDAQAEP